LHALIAASRFCDKDLSEGIHSGATCVRKPQKTKAGQGNTLNQNFAIRWHACIANNRLRLTAKNKSIAVRNAGGLQAERPFGCCVRTGSAANSLKLARHWQQMGIAFAAESARILKNTFARIRHAKKRFGQSTKLPINLGRARVCIAAVNAMPITDLV